MLSLKEFYKVYNFMSKISDKLLNLQWFGSARGFILWGMAQYKHTF